MRIPVPFASSGDLESRWRTLSASEKTLAGVLLGDASQMVLDECPDANLVPDGDSDAEAARSASLKRIVCGMVKRAMIASEAGPGVATQQETAGPFSGSVTFANPMGDLYLTKAERRALPCGRQQAFMINVGRPVEEVPPWWVSPSP